jgi:hypothetical protein
MVNATPRDVDPLTMIVGDLPAMTARAHGIYDATTVDLRAFKARGGKIIMWHGLADAAVPARASIDYYEKVQKTMGRATTDDFFRLFLLPGVQHCGNGPGLDELDTITAIENWVERGIAPSELVTQRYLNSVEERSRPVYPYPAVARFSGTGDPLRSSSFVPSPSRP